MRYIRHIVNNMDESMFQHCVLCSVIIADYRNSSWIGEAPRGWPSGPVYVSEGNPQIFTTSVNDEDKVIDCMNPFRNG